MFRLESYENPVTTVGVIYMTQCATCLYDDLFIVSKDVGYKDC